jgi:pimeloyl-ACP methyl ester carboxylesterase
MAHAFDVEAPWVRYPGTEPWWGGWRQGEAEGWLLGVWLPFWHDLDATAREAYLARWAPPSADWREHVLTHWATAPAGGYPMAPLIATRLRVDGHDTHCLETGRGAPFLFLPPSAFLHAHRYERILRGLGRHHRVLAPEQPGTGRSGRLNRRWRFEDHARWAVALLDRLGIDRAVVAGHSTGGGMALAMAAMFPERVERLVLVDTVGVTGGRSPARLLAARVLDGVFEMPLNLRAWPDALVSCARDPRVFFHHIGMALTVELLDHAPMVKAPTLLAWGGRDFIFPTACAEQLRAALPNATMHVSPDGCHDWLLLQPDRFVEAVTAWTQAPP